MMNRPESIAFCKNRIIEQNEYIKTTSKKKDISHERKRELLFSAIVVRKKFRSVLIDFVGLVGYVCFRLYEEY